LSEVAEEPCNVEATAYTRDGGGRTRPPFSSPATPYKEMGGGQMSSEDWSGIITGLLAVMVLVLEIAPEVKRYRQRHAEQHTTCEGCLHLRDEGECHNFAVYQAEGEVRPCYRKRLWRKKRGKP